MSRLTVFLFLFAAFAFAAYATSVDQCPNMAFDLDEKVEISTCKKPPCRFRHKTTAEFRLNFKLDHDVKSLRTNVNAKIGGIPFPFIGVDGTTACGKIFKPDGKTKVDCPLKKGEDYLYINSFKIYEQYPKIRLLVHWALIDTATNKAVTCFEVPARITG